jgi:uncharacterized protein YndB with AHSA1/START domain
MEPITIQATIQAKKDKVWDYYTEHKHITKWKFESDDWTCPSATNHLMVGGKYSARMEAKDGSFGFDFEGVYDEVVIGEKFDLTFMDSRKMAVVFSDNENTWVSLSGLADNFEKAATLFEKLLSNPVVEESVLKSLVADLQKERADSKLQKRLILNKAMSNYARYGALNPFSYVLTNEELDKISTSEIREIIQSLSGFQHKILFYGPQELEKVKILILNIQL